MRILFLSSEVTPERAGGIATYTSTIAPALAARGHDVHVLSCAPEHQSGDDHSHGVWWHRRPFVGRYWLSRSRGSVQSRRRLATAFSSRVWLRRLGSRFDVIESPEWMAESLFIGATRPVPLVVHLHTPLHILFRYNVARFSTDLHLADRLERWSTRRATLTTSASHLLADELCRQRWLTKSPEIIPLPVDLDEWKGVPSPVSSGPTILAVGRLELRKAPEIAVQAARVLASEIPHLSLVFLGRSSGTREGRPYGEWLAELAEREGVPVTFLPQMPHDQVHDIYSRARVVAVPSRFESFSITALEAMASARPVVVTTKVGAGEILPGNAAGRKVPPDDPVALADALRPYLLDAHRAEEAGKLGRKVVRAACSPDVVAEHRERCFENAIRMHRKGLVA